MSAALNVQVSAARMLTPVVREFTLVACDGTLPGFSPGSHVQVHLPLAEGKVRNAYSLTSDPAHHQHYRIAVRLQDVSRGGSQYLHRQVQVGDTLQISPPANLFAPHATARLHILIAAGIGITPFMAYIAALEQQQAEFELHYLCTPAHLRRPPGSEPHPRQPAAGQPRLHLRPAVPARRGRAPGHAPRLAAQTRALGSVQGRTTGPAVRPAPAAQ
jgi:hypothetical protein